MASNLSTTSYTDDLITNCIRVLQTRRYALNTYDVSDAEVNDERRPENPIIFIIPPSPEDENNDCVATMKIVQEECAINIAPQQSEDIAAATESASVVINLDENQEGTLAAAESGHGTIDGGSSSGRAGNVDAGAGSGGNYNYHRQQIMPMDIDEYEQSLGRTKCIDTCIGVAAFALLIGILFFVPL